MSAPPTLLLDPAIRDWVVLPMVLIMVITGLLRHSTTSILKSTKQFTATDRSNKSVLQRVGRLRMSGGFLSSQRYEARRLFWTKKEKGGLRPEGGVLMAKEMAGADGAMPGMPNPAAAMEGMMGQGSFMVQNMVMMQGIQHFFSGYVLLKVPFPLTKGFKSMFQRGIDLPTLDVSYVSSVSWYFLVMFGLRGFFRLVIGDPTEDTKTSMMLQMDLGNSPQQQQPFKAEPAFKGECDNLEISRYRSVIESSEKMLLGAKYPMAKAVARKAGNGRNAGDDIFQNFKKKESKEPGLVDESKKGK